MEWIINKINYHKIGFGIFSWVFVCVLSCFVFLGTNTYAVQDFELEWYGTTRPSYQFLCGNNSGRNCSDYHYMIIYQEFDSNYSFNSSLHPYISFNINQWSSMYLPLYPFTSPIIYPLSSNLDSIQYNAQYEVSDYTSLGVSIKVVLTDNYSMSTPTGSLSITENGTYDVTNYAEAVVNIPETVVYGDYHNDLIAINNSILICGAICLVIYFFYCIYRMIIKSVGGH